MKDRDIPFYGVRVSHVETLPKGLLLCVKAEVLSNAQLKLEGVVVHFGKVVQSFETKVDFDGTRSRQCSRLGLSVNEWRIGFSFVMKSAGEDYRPELMSIDFRSTPPTLG